jgi:SPP1 family phage portal protein
VIINNFEPLNWVPVQDESDKLVAAIYKAIVEPYTYYKGELLEEELTLYYHYDESMVHIYKAVKNQKTGKIELNLEEEYTHGYGVVPVIFFKTSKEFKSFFDESFLIQNDLYDVLSSAMVDDVKYAIDALLLIKGLDYTKLMAKGKDNVSVIQTLKSVGLFPIPKEADASFLTRNIDTEKFRFALKVCRENIHRMANCPDLVDKLNNEGSVNVTSGIALRLLFQGMEQQGSQFKKYFEEGLRKRIDLVNSIWSKLRFPILQDIQIEFKENIPINEIEIVNSIRQLDGLLAKKDQIALLPFISNPDIALYNLQEEQKNNPQETEKTINIL